MKLTWTETRIRLQRAGDRLMQLGSLVGVGACYVVILIGGAIIMSIRIAPRRS